MRAVIFDFGLSNRAEARVTRGLRFVGVATLGYGAWIVGLVTL